MDSLVKEEVKTCIPCLATVPQNNREPLEMTPLPNGPWEELKCDFFGPMPCGYLFVIIDEYSRYPIVEVLKSTSSEVVILVIDKKISSFDIPNVLTSDNGPPLNGVELKKL